MIEDPKSNTKTLILDTIRRNKRIARIDLAQATDISQATVTTITADMIKQGLIEEVPRDDGPNQMRRGRPRVDLKLRADAHVVAGMKVADASISVVLVDFEGQIISEHEYHGYNTTMPVADLMGHIEVALKGATSSHGISVEDLSAIGFGIAGMIDASRGYVHWSPLFPERNLELGAMLAQRLGKPVFIDNEANVVAMAEQYLGNAHETTDFIVVTIESGVGMAVVINNQIYRGNRGCGSEFGHTKVQLDGALCRCGQRGCLEAYVADYALLREASFNAAIFKETSTEQSVQNLLTAAREGDPTAQSIVNRSSRVFAMGLSNLVNLFDPQQIILCGERMQFDHLYAEDVVAAIKRSIVQVDAEPAEIVIHKWGSFMWARGAAAFALGGIADLALREGSERAA